MKKYFYIAKTNLMTFETPKHSNNLAYYLLFLINSRWQTKTFSFTETQPNCSHQGLHRCSF